MSKKLSVDDPQYWSETLKFLQSVEALGSETLLLQAADNLLLNSRYASVQPHVKVKKEAPVPPPPPKCNEHREKVHRFEDGTVIVSCSHSDCMWGYGHEPQLSNTGDWKWASVHSNEVAPSRSRKKRPQVNEESVKALLTDYNPVGDVDLDELEAEEKRFAKPRRKKKSQSDDPVELSVAGLYAAPVDADRNPDDEMLDKKEKLDPRIAADLRGEVLEENLDAEEVEVA